MKPRKKYVGAEFYVYHNWGDEHDRLKKLDLCNNEDRFIFESNLLQETFVVTERISPELYACESDWGRTFVGTKSWIDNHCLRIDNLLYQTFKISKVPRVVNSCPKLEYEDPRELAVGEVVMIVGHENYHFKLLTQNNFEWYPINSFHLEMNEDFELMN